MGSPLWRRVRPEPGCGLCPKSALVALPELRRDVGIARSLGRTLEEFYDLPDVERERQVAAWELERDFCKLHGGPFSECPDDQADWFVVRDICWPSARLEAANVVHDLLHEEEPWHDGSFKRWAEKPSVEFPFHYRAATSIHLSKVEERPWDQFLTDKNASPWPDDPSAAE